MLFEDNPLLSEYRTKLRTRLRLRVVAYVLIAACGFGWAINWYYTESVINAALASLAIFYLLSNVPTRKSLLMNDANNEKYKIFAQILIAEQEELNRKPSLKSEHLSELEEYLLNKKDQDKREL